MTNRYSLADLRADLDKQYAPLVLDLGDGEVTLRNLLRMPEKARNEVFDLMDQLDPEAAKKANEGDVDVESLKQSLDIAKDIIRIVTDGGKGETVVKLIGDDLALAMKIFELWIEATDLGEAGNSPDSSTSTASA